MVPPRRCVLPLMPLAACTIMMPDCAEGATTHSPRVGITCAESSADRCGGRALSGRMNALGTATDASDCANRCLSSQSCNYAVYRVHNRACSDFSACTSLQSGNGPWRICAVRVAPPST
eukprot:gene58106-biopygen37132